MPKKFRVEITRTAEADVESIWEFITLDSPDQALEFIHRLEEQINTLEKFPGRCSLIQENALLGTAYRHLVFGNYRTIFKIVKSRVIILRVVHCAKLLDTTILDE